MIAAMDFAKVFLTVADKRALRCASHATTNETRSLAERLIVMTRRASGEQLERGRLQGQYDADVRSQQAVMSEYQYQNARVRGHAATIAGQNGHIARLIRRMRELRVGLERGEFPDDDPDAFFAIDDGQ